MLLLEQVPTSILLTCYMLLSLYKKDKYPWRDITELKDTTKEKTLRHLSRLNFIQLYCKVRHVNTQNYGYT